MSLEKSENKTQAETSTSGRNVQKDMLRGANWDEIKKRETCHCKTWAGKGGEKSSAQE